MPGGQEEKAEGRIWAQPQVGRILLNDIRDLLEARTGPLRAQWEHLVFFEILRTHRLPKISIVSYVRCLAIIHAVLERKHDLAFPQTALLTADLEMMDAADIPSVSPAIRCALDWADEILGEADPLSLIGTLYALEEAQSYVLSHKSDYVRCLNMPGEKLSYPGNGADGSSWKAFWRSLGGPSLDDGQGARIAASAVRGFEHLTKIYAAAYPYAPNDLKHHATEVNFEAGDHAMPQDPAEIGLALRAGNEAWAEFPYLEKRYGARGKRFTNSDSCWLVTLARTSRQGVATASLNWLRATLAPRGIPTAILEAHLRIIRQAIIVEFPDEPGMQSRFDPFLADREAERRAHFGPAGKSPLVDHFAPRFRACSGLQVESAADLIASAWVDQRSGVAGALPALQNWLTDAARFSADWIASVNDLRDAFDRHHARH
jgi:hypothetical protein